MEAAEKLIRNIDFKVLKAQKRILEALTYQLEDSAEIAAIDGILSFIDAVQDIAVDDYYVDKYEVFNLSEDEDDNPIPKMSLEQAKEIINAD